MKLLIVTDAWHPQVNGVVQTLTMTAAALRAINVDVGFITPHAFRTVGLPGYPGIRLALPRPSQFARLLAAERPDAIHIATEGPIGLIARRYCKAHRLAVTTSFHTRFPDYVAARLPVPEQAVWALLRWFHRPSRAVMAATPALAQELRARGFANVALWPRGVDAALFRPRSRPRIHPGPVFLSVGRLAVEKNLRAFLSLDLPGTKLVVGDGPERAALQRDYPDAVFLGELFGEALADVYAAADVFVFPSRTDTFGLVLLEALACGVPVAAFPVTGPRDVIGEAPVGALNADLRAACLAALTLSRAACRSFAQARGWDASARTFLRNVLAANRMTESEAAAAGARRGARDQAAGRLPARGRAS